MSIQASILERGAAGSDPSETLVNELVSRGFTRPEANELLVRTDAVGISVAAWLLRTPPAKRRQRYLGRRKVSDHAAACNTKGEDLPCIPMSVDAYVVSNYIKSHFPQEYKEEPIINHVNRWLAFVAERNLAVGINLGVLIMQILAGDKPIEDLKKIRLKTKKELGALAMTNNEEAPANPTDEGLQALAEVQQAADQSSDPKETPPTEKSGGYDGGALLMTEEPKTPNAPEDKLLLIEPPTQISGGGSVEKRHDTINSPTRPSQRGLAGLPITGSLGGQEIHITDMPQGEAMALLARLRLQGPGIDGIDNPELGTGDAHAICAQTDPEIFFPEKGGSTRMAKIICRQCSVREKCLSKALEDDVRFGIWGGLSERERRKLKKLNNKHKEKTSKKSKGQPEETAI